MPFSFEAISQRMSVPCKCWQLPWFIKHALNIKVYQSIANSTNSTLQSTVGQKLGGINKHEEV